MRSRQAAAEGQSLQAIADELNQQAHTTRRGKAWNAMQVSQVLKRGCEGLGFQKRLRPGKKGSEKGANESLSSKGA